MNADVMEDMILLLRSVAQEESLPLLSALQLQITTFRTLLGPGRTLAKTIDIKPFLVCLCRLSFQIALPRHHCRVPLLLECIELALFQVRRSSSSFLFLFSLSLLFSPSLVPPAPPAAASADCACPRVAVARAATIDRRSSAREVDICVERYISLLERRP